MFSRLRICNFVSFFFLLLLFLCFSTPSHSQFSQDIYLDEETIYLSFTQNFNFTDPQIWIGRVVPGQFAIAHITTSPKINFPFNITINTDMALDGLVIGNTTEYFNAIFQQASVVIPPNVQLKVGQLVLLSYGSVFLYDSEITVLEFNNTGKSCALASFNSVLTFNGDFTAYFWPNNEPNTFVFYNSTIFVSGVFNHTSTGVFLESSVLSVHSVNVSDVSFALLNSTVNSQSYLEFASNSWICGFGILNSDEVIISQGPTLGSLGMCGFSYTEELGIPDLLLTDSKIFVNGNLTIGTQGAINLPSQIYQSQNTLSYRPLEVSGCVTIEPGAEYYVNITNLMSWADVISFKDVIISASGCLSGDFVMMSYIGPLATLSASPTPPPSFFTISSSSTPNSFSFDIYVAVFPNQTSSLLSPSGPSSRFSYLSFWAFSGIGAVAALFLAVVFVILGTRFRRRCDEVEESELSSERPQGEKKPLLGGGGVEEGRGRGNVPVSVPSPVPVPVPVPVPSPLSSPASPASLHVDLASGTFSPPSTSLSPSVGITSIPSLEHVSFSGLPHPVPLYLHLSLPSPPSSPPLYSPPSSSPPAEDTTIQIHE